MQKAKADPGHSDAVEDKQIRSTDLATKEISTMTYTEEQLNYFRMVYIVMNIFSTELRGLFKKEWNFAYRKPWRDTTTDGSFSCGQESPGNKRNKKFQLALIAKGDSNKFDNTTLFYCLLYSTSLGHEIRRRKKHVHNEINNLRELRNKVSHLVPHGEASRAEFDHFCRDACSAFTKLRLPTNDLQRVMKETSFETKELKQFEVQLLDTKRRLEEYEQYFSSKLEKAKCFQMKFNVDKHYRSLQQNGILTIKDVEALKRQTNKGLRSMQLIDNIVYKGSSTVQSFLQYVDEHEPACKELFMEAATTDIDIVAEQTGQVQVVPNSEHHYPDNFHNVMQIMTTNVYQKKWEEMEKHVAFHLQHSTSPALQFLIQIELAYGLGIKGDRERGEKSLDGAIGNMAAGEAGPDGRWLMSRALARKSLMYNYRKDYAGSRALAEQALSMIDTLESPEEHILCSKRIADCVLYGSGTIEEKRKQIIPLWDRIWKLCERNGDSIPRSKYYMRFVLADRARLELGFSQNGFECVPLSNLAQAEKFMDQLQQPYLKTTTEDTYTDAFRLICNAVIAFQRKNVHEAQKHADQVSAISISTKNEGIMLMIKHMQDFMQPVGLADHQDI